MLMNHMGKEEYIKWLTGEWKTNPRWKGVTRPYAAEDVYRLKGSVDRIYSLAKIGAKRLWQLFGEHKYIHALSAVTGNQAIQQVKAGLKAIYVSGWQVAADMNNSLRMYPDQSLYPSDSVPYLIKRINHSLTRADQIHHLKGDDSIYWMAPLVADAGPVNNVQGLADVYGAPTEVAQVPNKGKVTSWSRADFSI